jgi:tRNA A37 threonylcarbamoyladenosine modification protein TsaB
MELVREISVEEALKIANVSIQDVNAIGVTAGPVSYTHLTLPTNA